jgi:hypothetical protein
MAEARTKEEQAAKRQRVLSSPDIQEDNISDVYAPIEPQALHGQHSGSMQNGGTTLSRASKNFENTLNEIQYEMADIATEVALIEESHGDSNAQITLLTSIVIKQAKAIDHLKDTCVGLQMRSMKSNILIHNLPETPNENCIRACGQALTDLGIDQTKIDIEIAHRLGQPRRNGQRPMVARFNRHDHVQHILQITRP